MGLSVLAATATFRALADDPALAAKPEKTWTGTIVSVDAKEHALGLKGYFLSRTFNLGEHCVYTFVDQDAGTIGDLRPGQRMTVRYQDAHGVLVADRMTQQPMRYVGTVKAIDLAQHTLTLRAGGFDRKLQIAGDCEVALRNDKPGALTDIQAGNWVTVTYETPNETPTAREIAQTSATFTGELTAIDLETRTVKARAVFGTKKFSLGDNCAIVMNGKPNGQLADLRPGEKLTLSYDEVNGINVANRIAPASASPPTDTAAAQPMTSP